MKKNKSSKFILPMLGGMRRLFFYDTLLINCYIGTDTDKDCIVLVYSYSDSLLFNKFERAIIKLNDFFKAYETDKHVIFIFNVPREHIRNYKKFIAGKYSKFSLDYKLQILEFHDQEIEDPLGQILFRSERRRDIMEKALDAVIDEDSELYSIPNMEDEIFNPKYINYEQHFENPA